MGFAVGADDAQDDYEEGDEEGSYEEGDGLFRQFSELLVGGVREI